MKKQNQRNITKAIALALSLTLVLSLVLVTGLTSTSAATSQWQANTSYKQGDQVIYNGKVYECIGAHTALTGWEPPNVPALWKLIGDAPSQTPTISPTATPTPSFPTMPPIPQVYGYLTTGIQSMDESINADFKISVPVSQEYTDNNGFYKILVYNEKELTVSKPNFLTRTITVNVALPAIVGTEESPIVMWAGDLNADGAINMTDIMRMIQYFNSAKGDGKYDASLDFNKDNAINMTDIMIIVKNFNKTAANYPAPTMKSEKPTATPTVTITPTASQPTPTSTSTVDLPSKILVGYWHNFDNGSTTMRLRDVSNSWDVINVAFGETTHDRAMVEFSPFNCTDEEFKSDIAYLNSKGKKVVLSIGGQDGVVQILTDADREKFINSLIALIDKYGFNGLDIDLESGSNMNVGPADADFKNPKNPQLVKLIAASKTLKAKYGSGFILSMAPEVSYVQGGITAYGGNWGGYLPLIYGVKDILTYIHVQHYNCGGNAALDGGFYSHGTADFQVAMVDMLMQGFPIGNNPNNMFPALRPDQIVIGIPATGPAAPAGGYIAPAEMKKALDYIIKGKSFGGKYKQTNPNGYPEFRGLMTWSINWDAASGYGFSNNYRPYLDALGK